MRNYNEKTFECNMNDKNLFNCILEEVGEEDLNSLSDSAEILPDKTYINCLNASLVNCLRNNKKELDFPQVQLQIIKDKNEEWLIKQINVIVDKQFDDELIIGRINQCLKFVKRVCKNDNSIKLSFVKSEIKEDTKYYKIELNEVKQLLQEVRSEKSKKEELFAIFKNIANNK